MKPRLLFCAFILLMLNKAFAQPAVGTWSNTGPILFPVNVSGQVNGMGRVSQIKFHPTDPMKIYAVSASGGLFISTNNGVTWAPTPGTEVLPTTACSSVCIDYTTDDILYLSTGDQNYYNDDFGIWKSTDGGTTWSPANTDIGNRMAVEIIMDPTDHNILIAATDDGVWRTINGGATWTETIIGGAFKSMKQRPGSNNVLYAATPDLFYRSMDMGLTWTNITSGVVVPTGNEGIRIAVTPADSNLVFLGTTDGYGEILKSIDGGASFVNIYTSTTQCIVCYDSTITSGSQGYYNFNLTVNPANPNELLLVSHCVWRSTDGGYTWSWRTQWYDQVHTDMHDIEFNPYNLNQRFNANDGGVWLSTDTLATTWSPWCNGLAATEIYHAAQDPILRQMVSIGTQDNGELYYDGTWKCNRGGDWSARDAFDYSTDATVYYMNTGNRRTLLPVGGDANFNSPFVPTNNAFIDFVPSMSNVVFAGKDTLSRSMNINTSSPTWTQLYVSTGEDMKSIASCRGDSNILYFVTNSNHLYRSDNALASSPTFTMLSTPASTNVMASIATDKHNSSIVYLSCNNKIYRSANKGVSWTNITTTLPAINILKVIADDYSTNERLFVCEGNSVYYKDNTSTTWTVTSGLPSIPQITDMMIYNDSTGGSILRLSTYGRGAWEINIHNDLPPVGGLSSDKQYLCPGDTIHYGKYIYGNATSFEWSFPGGTPATSTTDSPYVVYAAPGTYNATLTIYGPAGNDTVIRTSYIVVSNGSRSAVTQSFEGVSFPPTQWTESSESGYTWQQTAVAGGYGLSAHSMLFDNYDNNGNGKHDRIITQQLDLTHADTAFITFDVAYSFYPGYRDSLMVEVSTDCGRTFTAVYEKDSTILATAPDTTANFVPGPGEWRTDTISLTHYFGSVIKLAFDNIGHFGENIYIDNVNIHVVTPTTQVINSTKNMVSLDVFPNPSKGIIFIKANGINGNSALINCYNEMGVLVASKVEQLNSGGFSASLTLANMAPGIYLLKVLGDDGSTNTTQVVLQ